MSKSGDKVLAVGRPKYGHWRDNMRTVAAFWSAYLSATTGANVAVRAEDVPRMMQLLKIGRMATGTYLTDNQRDVTGYGNIDNWIHGVNLPCGQNREKQVSSSEGSSDQRERASRRRGSRKGPAPTQ